MSEWSPYDEDSPKVHYDLAGWSPDQQSDLVELLVESEILHGWEGSELIVPDWAEAMVDDWCSKIEGQDRTVVAGPEVEFDLSEWDTHQLSRCAEALVTARIPHRWESAIVVVSEHDALVTEKLIESFDDLGIEIIVDES